MVPDGIYRMRVVRRDEGRVIDSVKEIRVDTRAAAGRADVSAKPRVIATELPGETPSVTLALSRARRTGRPEFRVFRTDDAAKPHVVRRFRGKAEPDGRLGRPR